MNAEYLLDAIGQLDDDLVREAERYRRPRTRYGPLLGWVACFSVMLLLSYGVTHLGMGGGGNSMAPANGGGTSPGGYSGVDTPDTAIGSSPGGAFEPDTPTGSAPSSGEYLPGDPQGAPLGTVFVRGAQRSGTYILNDEIVAELPKGGEHVLLGSLLALEPDSPSPCTDVEEYVGLNLWAESSGTDLPSAVYVELPAGGFARAELAEP